jgi:hypothetical protein
MEAPDHNLPRNLLKGEASAFSGSSLTVACGSGDDDDDDDLTAPLWGGITYEYLFYRNVAVDSTDAMVDSYPFLSRKREHIDYEWVCRL